jgi:MerR HTH family regulatory protein
VTAQTQPRMLRSPEVCDVAGISYRQLDYWTRLGYLHPAHRGGIGYDRAWSQAEAVKVCAMAAMVRAGLRPSAAARYVNRGQMAELVARPLPDPLDLAADDLAALFGEVA